MKWVRNNFNLFGLLSRRGVLIHRYWELVTVLHLSAVLMVTLYIDFFFFQKLFVIIMIAVTHLETVALVQHCISLLYYW